MKIGMWTVKVKMKSSLASLLQYSSFEDENENLFSEVSHTQGSHQRLLDLGDLQQLQKLSPNHSF